MTLHIHLPAGTLTVVVAPHVIPTPQNLARELRAEGVPPHLCGALGRMLAAAAEAGFCTLEAGSRPTL